MRMWMLPPTQMCPQHLLGEHYELHMLAGHICRGRKLGKYLTDGLVDPSQILQRHAELVTEMKRRGFNHDSPLDELTFATAGLLAEALPRGCIDLEHNRKDLRARCKLCAPKEEWP